MAAAVVVLGEGEPGIEVEVTARASDAQGLREVLAGLEGDVVLLDPELRCSGPYPVADVLVPGASRLRAAFGPYTLDTPTATGKQAYTIPVSGDAYGHRAGEFTDLFPVRLGPQKTPFLARDLGRGAPTPQASVGWRGPFGAERFLHRRF